MKKVVRCLLLLVLLISLPACKDQKVNEDKKSWPEKTYFDSLPVPSETIDKITKDQKDNTHTEYSIYVNTFTYEEFYNYIKSLEDLGFHYEFFNTSVPENYEDLPDKTETSWGANNGKIWIRALWRGKDNVYYNAYNFQLIFNNYDYLQPIES